ncbi:hypothetical protein FITA111629_08595 [Filibacter tadaridae]|uniref:Uncharacterized protein n=1 Tax=Filibacter tadaridae TaxID=2483811 RepID=A0A3P5XC14_9BACL|nr:hypothetical protein [Filibacter tadaridae]VDC26007.1 hypothetical protein FILTAD_01424 [Filibacter tadaridae]
MNEWKKGTIFASLIIMVVVVAFLFIDQTSHKVSVDNKQVEQAYINDLSERTLKLAKLLKQSENFSLNNIKVDLENSPNRVIYVNLIPNRTNEINDIEKSVREVLQSEKAKSLIQKKETFDIIVLNTDREKVN